MLLDVRVVLSALLGAALRDFGLRLTAALVVAVLLAAAAAAAAADGGLVGIAGAGS